ncbi:MAG TPA: XRE family transcriptional regulator [Chthonomonadaceae bacterium]|nr:XRE family transcriptional regulator [Chthonomonadaceae bacterium]
MTDDIFRRIAPAELGRRLAAARRQRNLSQVEVAQRLELSRPTLVAIEKGARPIKPEELTLLAQLYGRSVHELVRQREFVTDFAPLFRVTQVADVGPDSVAEAVKIFQQACEDYLSLEALLSAPMPRYAYPEPYSSGGLNAQAAAEEVATMERSRLNLGQGPLANLLGVLENDVGLRVFVLPLPEFRIAGMFAYTDRLGGCVLVNGSHPPTRQHWSMAHEYAHFLTDRYREDMTILFEYERKPRAEQFADAFAASFLMPAAGLRQRFRRVVQSRSDFTVADLCLLADQYAVSVEAMTLRLESLGCIQAGTWGHLSSQGFESGRMRAHLGLKSAPAPSNQLPERYVRLAVQAFEEEKITESELMRLLRCRRVEAREIANTLIRPTELGPSGEPYQLDLNFGDTLDLTQAERIG